MSAVRIFNDVPHIVRYGMCDEEEEQCWILFWRNGIQFTINVDKKDVHDTAFYSVWWPLLRERPEPGETMKDYVQNQWHPLCDLIISHSMATLQKLAPDRPYWITVKDYLHTSAYTLKLVKDRDASIVYAELMAGPVQKGAYEFQPFPAAAFNNVPKDIPQFASGDLVVLEKAENWRIPPEKVRTPDGHVCVFKACQRSSTSVETGEVTNTSLESIEAHLKLFDESQSSRDISSAGKSTVLGIVTDNDTETSDTLIAGILFSHII